MKNISFFFFIITFLACSTLYAQKYDKNHTILWKISGNGLTKPSYVYGTMHVRDKRAFNFSDSVYLKIDECKYFALEIHPDSMIKNFYLSPVRNIVLNKFEEMGSSKKEDVIEIEDGSLGKNKFKVKTKSDKDIIKEYFFLNDDKNTFLDAHLYHIARVRSKEIIGLEKIDDHRKAIEIMNESTKSKSGAELPEDFKLNQKFYKIFADDFINKYNKGILEYFNKDIEDSLQISRNKVMYESSLPYLADGGIFMAVGVSHLCGASGLIAQYKAAGYTVEPVKAMFSGLTKKLNWDKLSPPWIVNKYEMDGLQFSTPTTAFDIAPSDAFGVIKMLYAVDIGKGQHFVSMAFPNLKELDMDSITNLMLGVYTDAKTKKITHNGQNGKEYVINLKDAYLRFRLFIVGKRVYYHAITSEVEKAINDEHAITFLNSLVFLTVPEQQSQDMVYVNPSKKYSVNTNLIPRDNRTETPAINGKTIELSNVFLDYNKNVVYFISEFISPPNQEIFYFNQLKDNIEEGMKNTADTIYYIKLLNEPKCIEYFMKAQGSWLIGRLFLKGSLMYEVRGMSQKEANIKEVENFVQSFTFLPQKSEALVKHQFDNFSISLSPYQNKDTLAGYNGSWFKNKYTFASKDTLTGSIFKVEAYNLNPYYTVGSKDSLSSFYMENLIGYEDTITFKKNRSENDFMFTSSHKKSPYCSIDHLVKLCGNNIYHLTATHDLADFDTVSTNQFLTSFVLNNECEKTNFTIDTTSMKNLLIDKIYRNDTVDLKFALFNLEDYSYDALSLKKIAEAIESHGHQMANNTNFYHTTLLTVLFNSKYKDAHTLVKNLIGKKYLSIEDKMTIIRLLLDTYDADNYALVKEIVNEDKKNVFSEDNYSYAFYPITDSIQCLKWLMPDFIGWCKSDTQVYNINLITKGLKEKVISIDDLVEYRPTIEYLLKKGIAALEIVEGGENGEDGEEFEYNYMQYIDLSSYCGLACHFVPLPLYTDSAAALLLKDEGYYNVTSAIEYILTAKLKIDYTKQLERVYSQVGAKYKLYKLQEQFPNEKIMPQSAMTRDSFAVAKMEQSLNDLEEYYDFSNLKLTGKETLDNKTMYKISFTGYDSVQVYAILVLKNSSNSIEDDRYPYYQVYYPDDETAAVIEEDAFKKLMDDYKKSLLKK